MSGKSNHQILLETILEKERAARWPSLKNNTHFEVYVAEQLLRSYDLSPDEIMDGLVSGPNDGGIDCVYSFVNQVLITEDHDVSLYKSNVEVCLYIIQAKRKKSFSEEAIHKFDASSTDLLDFETKLPSIARIYNPELLSQISTFRSFYKEIINRFPKLKITFVYATLGDTPHLNVVRKGEKLQQKVKGFFPDCDCEVLFLGANQLYELSRRVRVGPRELTLSETPISTKPLAYLCLVRLNDYFNFIVDENKELDRSLFESNVRDHQKKSEVNEAIAETLTKPMDEDFWWLNNGVTILATKGHIQGKALMLEDPQIVNGLQTSAEIYQSMRTSGIESDDLRNILVRILIPESNQSRDSIIRATNSQTPIEPATLRATAPIHRDIEDYLSGFELYYDRRKNQHRNAGRPTSKIVRISFLAQAVMAILLGEPHNSRARPSSLLKDEYQYERVFDLKYPLQTYLICVQIMKCIQEHLRNRKKAERVEMVGHNNIQYHLAAYIARIILHKKDLRAEDLCAFEVSQIDTYILHEAADNIVELWQRNVHPPKTMDQYAKSKDSTQSIMQLLA